MINGKTISITTGCLNRLEFLRRSLATWIVLPEPDEILIVDWSNSIPLEESLRDFTDSRIVIARVIDQPTWKNAKCHNLEVSLASGDVLLHLDSDYEMSNRFFLRHPLQVGRFYAGNWRPHIGDVEKCSLAGVLYALRADILAVNGYNERLVYYGCEDDDLFERMAATGLERVDVDISTISHIPHSDTLRYEHLEIASKLPQMAAHQSYDQSLKKLFLVNESRKIASKRRWSTSDHRTPWTTTATTSSRKIVGCVETVEPRTVLVDRTPFDESSIDCLAILPKETVKPTHISSNCSSFDENVITSLFALAKGMVGPKRA